MRSWQHLDWNVGSKQGIEPHQQFLTTGKGWIRMTRVGTGNLSSFPTPSLLKKIMQSMAALDAIISTEWEYRYYSFNSVWGDGEMMGSMRNGSGDDLFILFSASGAFVKGFSHEQWEEFPADEAYREVASCFAEAVSEPAFSPELVTFCCWYAIARGRWEEAAIPPFDCEENGSAWMLSEIDGDATKYTEFAKEYYEVEIDEGAVRSIYNHVPMTVELAKSLNAEVDYRALMSDLAEIGYPVAT